MPVAYVDSTSTGVSDAQDSGKSIAVPTDAAVNHIAVLAIEVWLDTSTDPIIGWPSGFTQKTFYEDTGSGFQRVIIGWKRLTAADSGTYNYTITNGTYWNQAQCILVSGCTTTGDPFEAVDTDQNSTGTSLPSSSVITTVNPFLLNIIANENSATKTPPTSFTEVEDANYLEMSYRIPGSSGTYTTSGGSTSASTLKLNVLMALKEAGAAGTDLVIQDATLALAADNITITQEHTLVIQEARQLIAVDSPAFTQNHILIVQDATITQTADNLTLTQHIDLAIQKAVMAMSSDNLNLSQVHQITIHKAFLQTAADVVNMSGEEGGIVSVTDVQVEKLQALTSSTGSIQDLEHKYYGSLSGLAPVAAFSVSDHQKAYYAAQTGLSGSLFSMADLERAFYDVQLVPSGSLADREYVYWSSL